MKIFLMFVAGFLIGLFLGMFLMALMIKIGGDEDENS